MITEVIIIVITECNYIYNYILRNIYNYIVHNKCYHGTIIITNVRTYSQQCSYVCTYVDS